MLENSDSTSEEDEEQRILFKTFCNQRKHVKYRAGKLKENLLTIEELFTKLGVECYSIEK